MEMLSHEMIFWLIIGVAALVVIVSLVGESNVLIFLNKDKFTSALKPGVASFAVASTETRCDNGVQIVTVTGTADYVGKGEQVELRPVLDFGNAPIRDEAGAVITCKLKKDRFSCDSARTLTYRVTQDKIKTRPGAFKLCGANREGICLPTPVSQLCALGFTTVTSTACDGTMLGSGEARRPREICCVPDEATPAAAMFVQIMLFKNVDTVAAYPDFDVVTSSFMIDDLIDFYAGAEPVGLTGGLCSWVRGA